jgi:pimeloyl-ACP methyl ester carboxylesterase
VRPNGPYALLGYSWGGVIAFEVANRLVLGGGEVRRLVLLDTRGPSRYLPKYLRSDWPWRLVLLSFLGRHGIANSRLLSRLGARAVSFRILMAFGPGPLTERELRRVLRLTSCSHGDDLERLSFEELCSALVTRVKLSMSGDEWIDRISVTHLPLDNPIAIAKSWKVLVKNRLNALRHKPTAVFPGTITVYASSGNRGVLRWQQYSQKPLEVVWLPSVEGKDGTAHDRFLEPQSVALYSQHLETLLRTASIGAGHQG